MSAKIIAVLAIAIVGTIVTVMALGGSVPFLSQTGGGSSSPVFTGVTPQSPNAEYQNKVTFEVKPSILANNTSVADDANPIVIKYYTQKADGGYNFIAQSDTDTDGTEDITVGQDDIFWAGISMASSPSPAVYIDWQATRDAKGDGTVGIPRFLDLDKDNRAEFVFPLDLSVTKANADPNLQPTYQWFPKLHGDGDVDLSNATGVANKGQGTIETTIEWELTFDFQPNAYGMTGFEVRYNSTGSSVVDKGASWVDVPDASEADGFKRIFFTDMDASETSGVTSLKYNFCNAEGVCNKISGANLLTVGATGSKKLDMPVTITHTFDVANEGLCVELSINKIDARNTISEDEMTDDYEIAEGAITHYCTIS